MKGITHFLTGVATATCFPLAVQSAYTDKTFLIALGGFFGVLCDTLDFKFARYFWKHDYRVRLTEDHLDPREPAETIARAIDQAAETGKPVRVKLDIIRLSTNYYRTYAVLMDDKKKEVTCMIGPLKTMSHVMDRGEHMPADTSKRNRAYQLVGAVGILDALARQTPALPDSTPTTADGAPLYHTATFKADLHNTYYQDSEVGIFSGPDFEFDREPNGKVRADFIPWHRRWTHSLTLGLLMGPIGFALYAGWRALAGGDWAGFFNPLAINAFFIAILAFWSHILVDQTGHLGSNLFPPFTKKRSPGWYWCTSGSPFPNFLVNWLSISIIIWNLNAYAPTPVFTLPWAAGIPGGFGNPLYYLVSLINYAAYCVALPLLILYLIVRIYRRKYYDPREMRLEEGFSGSDYAGGAADL